MDRDDALPASSATPIVPGPMETQDLESKAEIGSTPKPAVTIVVPAYNEVNGIQGVLEELRAQDPTWEVLVVDDGSTDGTAEIVQKSGFRVLRHEVNRGYGASLKTGIRAAAADRIVITDADGTYPNERISEIVSHLDRYDMVVGARIGDKVHIPLIRRPAKWALNRLADYLSGTHIPDLNSGLRAFRKDQVVRFFDLLPSGFSFTTTITLSMQVNELNVLYIPIDYHQRKGNSKIRPIHDTLNFIQLIVRTVMYFRPLKVFLPVAAILLLTALGVLFYSWYFTPKIMDASVSIILMSAFQMAGLGMLADLIDKRSGLG